MKREADTLRTTTRELLEDLARKLRERNKGSVLATALDGLARDALALEQEGIDDEDVRILGESLGFALCQACREPEDAETHTTGACRGFVPEPICSACGQRLHHPIHDDDHPTGHAFQSFEGTH